MIKINPKTVALTAVLAAAPFALKAQTNNGIETKRNEVVMGEFRRADFNHDSFVSQGEFNTYMESSIPIGPYDNNPKDGYLNLREFRNALLGNTQQVQTQQQARTTSPVKQDPNKQIADQIVRELNYLNRYYRIRQGIWSSKKVYPNCESSDYLRTVHKINAENIEMVMRGLNAGKKLSVKIALARDINVSSNCSNYQGVDVSVEALRHLASVYIDYLKRQPEKMKLLHYRVDVINELKKVIDDDYTDTMIYHLMKLHTDVFY